MAISQARSELLSELDTLGERSYGDEWIVGMRVHYRVDGGMNAAADSTAQRCRVSGWWCAALRGYAAHALGDEARAESAFLQSEQAMPQSVTCEWRDIAPLLPDQLRDRYEHMTCEARRGIETRYWVLSRPQLGAASNDWRNEYWTRRVITRLAQRAANPHGMSWGRDAAELVLRYGWPHAWGRVRSTGGPLADAAIVGHDRSPSWVFTPVVSWLDSLQPADNSAWQLRAPFGESRYAPRLVTHLGEIAVQFARFRRGDSTLLVAAYGSTDDSLVSPRATLAATSAAGTGVVVRNFSGTLRTGTGRLMVANSPLLVGVDITDTLTKTLARARELLSAARDSSRVTLSDLLLHRALTSASATLDAILPNAIPGDTVIRSRPLGIYWETYGLAATGESVELTVSVERVDRGWLRSTRQRLGLADRDAPIRIRWRDTPARANGAASQAVSLDLANLPGGRYRVRVSVTVAGGVGASTAREIELRER